MPELAQQTPNPGQATEVPPAPTLVPGTQVPVATEVPVEVPAEVGETPAGVSRDPASGKFAPPPKWATERIDQLTAARKDAERAKAEFEKENSILKAALAQMQAPNPASPKAPEPGLAEAEIDRRATLKAKQTRDAEVFEANASKLFENGRKEFADFESVLGNFSHLGPVDNDTITAAFETGQAHRVLYALAQDLDEAQRVLALPPMKRAVELERIAQRMAKVPTAVSKAPPPINPLSARAASATDELRDEDDMSDWVAKREAQLALKRKRA